jgi:hypothetical protein
MREPRVPAGPEELRLSEADMLTGFVLVRAAAELSDRTISAGVVLIIHPVLLLGFHYPDDQRLDRSTGGRPSWPAPVCAGALAGYEVRPAEWMHSSGPAQPVPTGIFTAVEHGGRTGYCPGIEGIRHIDRSAAKTDHELLIRGFGGRGPRTAPALRAIPEEVATCAIIPTSPGAFVAPNRRSASPTPGRDAASRNLVRVVVRVGLCGVMPLVSLSRRV